METQPLSDLLDCKEAAATLGVSVYTVRRWIATGDLPAFKLGGRLRVSRGDALAMLKRVDAGGSRLETRAERDARDAETDRVLRAFGVRR